VEQKEGDFIIAWGWHWGYNSGVNVAEAINFITDQTMGRMRNAKLCSSKCYYSEQDYTFDMDEFESDLKDHNPMDYDTDSEERVLISKKGKQVGKIQPKRKAAGKKRKVPGEDDDYN
jgi:hypothetical protein